MAWKLVMAFQSIQDIEKDAAQACADGRRDVPVPSDRIRDYLLPTITYCRERFKEVELTAALARINPHFLNDLAGGLTYDQLRVQAKVLREAVQSELTLRRFAYVPTEKAKVLDALEPAWKAVWSKFPSIKDDSSEAVECYALGRNTASVFHLMRVAERGLRILAREQKIKLKKGPLEWAEWNDILQALDTKSRAFAQLPRGPARDAAQGFYQGAVREFEGFKNEYRNHVMHARAAYDEHQAARALRQVHDFMDRLALRLDETGRKISWRKVAKESTA